MSKKDFSQAKLIKVSVKTNGRCFYCNRWGQVVDHFIPKAKWVEYWDKLLGDLTDFPWVVGSPHQLENLFLACYRCNTKKGSKLPWDFVDNAWKLEQKWQRANHRVLKYAMPD